MAKSKKVHWLDPTIVPNCRKKGYGFTICSGRVAGPPKRQQYVLRGTIKRADVTCKTCKRIIKAQEAQK